LFIVNIFDSGPLIISQHDDRAYVVGASSFGPVNCSSAGVPSVFARTSAQLDWITDIIGTECQAPELPCKCGILQGGDASSSDSRIDGGSDASEMEHPWVVYFYNYFKDYFGPGEDGYSSTFCGGTLLSPKYILTEAWCVEDGTSTEYTDPQGEIDWDNGYSHIDSASSLLPAAINEVDGLRHWNDNSPPSLPSLPPSPPTICNIFELF
jgi:secreted trypsin-like serine protease